MKIVNIQGNEVTLMGVNHYSAGAAGRYGIICYFEYEGVEFSIYATTTNMSDFDKAMDFEDYRERDIALYNIIAYQIEDNILDEIHLIDEE